MSAEITAADFLWGPIALLINGMEHGFPPSSVDGAGELIASILGTGTWAVAIGAIGSLR